MNVYTTYFARLRKLDSSITPVAVCLYPPQGYAGLRMPELAPPSQVFRRYKQTGDFEEFTKGYVTGTLGGLNFERVKAKLTQLSNDGNVALVCYEKDPKMCHRSILAEWLKFNGLYVKELEFL